MDWYYQRRLELMFPMIKPWEKWNNRKMKFEERKGRIFMRGVKIGEAKKGTTEKANSIFEMRRRQEKEIRSTLSNADLDVKDSDGDDDQE